jgi:hypothetical protein
MVGAVATVSVVGPPCRFQNSSGGSVEVISSGVVVARKQGHGSSSIPRKFSKLHNSMTHAWQDSRHSARVLVQAVPCSTSGHHAPMVVDELGGQYEDTFDDVEKVCYFFLSSFPLLRI